MLVVLDDCLEEDGRYLGPIHDIFAGPVLLHYLVRAMGFGEKREIEDGALDPPDQLRVDGEGWTCQGLYLYTAATLILCGASWSCGQGSVVGGVVGNGAGQDHIYPPPGEPDLHRWIGI